MATKTKVEAKFDEKLAQAISDRNWLEVDAIFLSLGMALNLMDDDQSQVQSLIGRTNAKLAPELVYEISSFVPSPI